MCGSLAPLERLRFPLLQQKIRDFGCWLHFIPVFMSSAVMSYTFCYLQVIF